MSFLCVRIAIVSQWKITFGGSLEEDIPSGGAQCVERSTTGSNQTGF